MASQRNTDTDLTAVQHPIIARSALPEAIIQLIIMGAVVAILEWMGVRFEITLFVLLILGFSFNTMNMMAATVSQNVHLAEIRDLLSKQSEETKKQS